MESHKGIGMLIVEPALYLVQVHIRRNAVVDVKQGYRVIGNALSDKFAESTVDVYLTGNRDTHCAQTAVNVAGNKAELSLERRPALICKNNIFAAALVSLSPVKESKLVLRKLRQDTRHFVSVSKLLFHISDNVRDTFVTRVLVIGREQVKL